MARRLILNICIFMLLVCALLTLLIVLDAAARLKSEERRHAELVASLMTDWVQGAQELEQAPNWPEVDRRLSSSALIESWVIVSRRAEDGSLAIETAQPSPQELGADAARLREVLEQGRLITSGGRVYAPIGGLRSTYAARFDLRAPVAGAAPILSGLGGLVAVMALGTALVVLNAYILLNRWVLRPMQSLVEASRRVSEGDFSKKIPPRATADEMAELVNAFNLMLEKIARHQATLVDDVRKAQERVTKTEKRLFAAQRLSTTGTLAAGIAHEINNPLAGMINAARTMQAGSLPPEKRQEYFELIVEGLERIRTIAQKVLQFRPKELQPQPVSLKDVVARAAGFMDHRARQKGVDIRNELPEDLPRVEADPLELQQAILNILMNAADACVLNEGVIRITHRVEDAWVTVLVEDNGCGMSDEELAHCMDLFYTTKDVGEGTGLGLSVAHNIVQNHGGKIEIRSRQGQGTTVSVRLPTHKGSTRRRTP